MQPFVVRGTVVNVALVVDFQGFDQEGQGTGLCLGQIFLPQLFADLQKLHRHRVFAYQKTPQMVAHATHKMLWLKALADDVVQNQENVAGLSLQYVIDDLEIIVIIQNIQIVNDILVGDVFSAETHHLVKNGKRVTQGTVGFLRDDVQGFRLCVLAFALGDKSQMLGNIIHCNPFEVKYLAA